MSEIPPPYANYPRNAAAYGSASQLQALSDGYFGLSKVFVINIIIALASNFGIRGGIIQGPLIFVVILAIGITIGFLTYGPNKRIGEGAGWSSAQPVVASVLMGLNSAVCCGVIGYAVMQSIASNHMKRFGVKGGLFGLKKSVVESAVNELADRERSGRVV